MNFSPGFIGSAKIGNGRFRCTDFSLNLKQTPLFYDHIIGLRDSVPTSIANMKSDVGNRNEQKKIWRPSTIIIDGGLSFPWTNNSTAILWETARKGDTFSLSFDYNCGIARKFSGCKVNTYTIKASAGEVVSSDLAIIGTSMENESQTSGAPLITTTDKLVTWDNASITFGTTTATLSYFECTISNNCLPIYTNGGLAPYEIRVGMQMVTGTLAYFGADSIGTMAAITSATSFIVKIGSWSQKFNVIFNPQQQNAAIGPIITPIQFTGVDDALPDKDEKI